jgi:hypothetical protein
LADILISYSRQDKANDTDLDPLREHARVKKIVSDAKARFALQEAAGSSA